jgi:hypothetical protein
LSLKDPEMNSGWQGGIKKSVSFWTWFRIFL